MTFVVVQEPQDLRDYALLLYIDALFFGQYGFMTVPLGDRW